MLDLQSQQTTALPSQTLSPRVCPICLKREEIGQGEFGTVCKVIDVSTGSILAGKEFYKMEWEREVKIMRRMSHVSIIIRSVRSP